MFVAAVAKSAGMALISGLATPFGRDIPDKTYRTVVQRWPLSRNLARVTRLFGPRILTRTR